MPVRGVPRALGKCTMHCTMHVSLEYNMPKKLKIDEKRCHFGPIRKFERKIRTEIRDMCEDREEKHFDLLFSLSQGALT